MQTKIRLNLGSYNKKLEEDFINVDVLDLENVDLFCNLSVVPFYFKVRRPDKIKDWDFLDEEYLSGTREFKLLDRSVDEIVMEEVLEHLSFRITTTVLKEIYRILKVGGKLRIQVPDCGKAMKAWMEKKICNCVPHKPLTIDGFRGRPSCPQCHGGAVMDWERWLFSFTGAQKHDYDIHRAVFTKDILDYEIRKAGFGEYKFTEHPVKLKVECIK